MASSAFHLLSLPAELRLHIFDLLLAPSDPASPTIITRSCRSKSVSRAYLFPLDLSHDLSDHTCCCIAEPFTRLGAGNDSLTPAVLVTNKQVHNEALPCLYRRRTFAADGNRPYATPEDRMRDAWFLLIRFFERLSPKVRRLVYGVRLPLALCSVEVHGCREAFYILAKNSLGLRRLELEVYPGILRRLATGIAAAAAAAATAPGAAAQDQDGNDDTAESDADEKYWLGPVMAFESTASIHIMAVDVLGQNAAVFAQMKPIIETRVWAQIVLLRGMRGSRTLRRIGGRLDALDVEEGLYFDTGCGLEE